MFLTDKHYQKHNLLAKNNNKLRRSKIDPPIQISNCKSVNTIHSNTHSSIN